jgi:hypothetical protein
MKPPATFDERARTLTQSLLADAARTTRRVPRDRANTAPWKVIAMFAATVVVIGGAVVGASVALHDASVAKPIPASHAGTWKSFQLPSGEDGGSAISCPDDNECVAVDYAGNVFVSTDPGGGPEAWKVTSVEPATARPPGKELTGVSCADPSLCVAVGLVGDVVTSTNPDGGAAAWTLSRIDGQATLNGISCPSVRLCVAVGSPSQEPPAAGLVFTSTDPAGGPGTWTATKIDGVSELIAISCPAAQFCVAIDGLGTVVTSTDPTGGAAAWQVSEVAATFWVTAINCPTVHLCVAVDEHGGVVTSTHPTGGTDAWTRTTLDGSPFLMSVSCPSATFCIAGAQSDYAFVTNDPTGGSEAWMRQRVSDQGLMNIYGLSCPSSRFCVGVGYGGDRVYTNPAA